MQIYQIALNHCNVIADKALQMAQNLVLSGIDLNLNQLKVAALLHDIAYAEKENAAVGTERVFAPG